MTDLASRGRVRARRLRKPLLAVVAASMAAALVAGCSGGSDSEPASAGPPPGTPLPEGAQLVQESSKTTQTLQSVHLDLLVANIPGLPVESVSADVTNQPQGAGQAIGEAKVRTEPDGPFIDSKFIVVDKTLYAQTGGASYAPVGDAEKMYDPGVILDKDKGLANVLANVENAKAEAREKIDGIDTVKVTGTIDAKVIDPIVPRVGENAGTMPITLWITDVAPPTSEVSLPSEDASPGTGPNLVRAVVTKDSGTVTVTLSGWGKKVEVVKPQG